MNTTAIRQKLYEYIRVADDKKVRAFYTIIQSDHSETEEWWKDKDFIASLDRISGDLKSGADNGHLWEDVKSGILKSW